MKFYAWDFVVDGDPDTGDIPKLQHLNIIQITILTEIVRSYNPLAV